MSERNWISVMFGLCCIFISSFLNPHAHIHCITISLRLLMLFGFVIINTCCIKYIHCLCMCIMYSIIITFYCCSQEILDSMKFHENKKEKKSFRGIHEFFIKLRSTQEERDRGENKGGKMNGMFVNAPMKKCTIPVK